jgi:hypothetical protein
MRAVTRELDLVDFSLVKDDFNQGPSLEEGSVKWRMLVRLHVLAYLGNQVQLMGAQDLN